MLQKVSVRHCCRARPGYVWASFDYSGQELRVAAALSGCRAMLEVFLEARERPHLLDDEGALVLGADGRPLANPLTDLHLMAAFNLYPEMANIPLAELRAYGDAKLPNGQTRRKQGKVLGLGMMYGMSAASLAERLHSPLKQAERFIDLYFAGYPELGVWLENASNHGRTCGYVVNELGLLLFVNESNAKGVSGDGSTERKAANALVQSTSAQMCKMAFVRIAELFEDMPEVLGPPVHDELNLFLPGEWPVEERLDKDTGIVSYVSTPLDGMVPANAAQELTLGYALQVRGIMEDVMSELLTPGLQAAFPERPGLTFPAAVDCKINYYWEH